MTDDASHVVPLPHQQQVIRAKCVPPTGTFIPFPRAALEQSIPARFAQQVSQDPRRVAVHTQRDTLTYEALNQAANRVAHTILAQRGTPSEPVGLLLEKGAQLIIATLGVLKAGKTCVVLEPSFPISRLTFLLQDAQARLVLTNSSHLTLATELAPGMTITLLDDMATDGCPADPDVSIAPDTLAYIIYTSGSTGQPKGVMHTHRTLMHSCMTRTNDTHICRDDRLSSFAPTPTIGATYGLFTSILNGATYFPLDIAQHGIHALAAWLEQHRITVTGMSPTLFRHFVRTLTGPESLSHLRLFAFGGEPLEARDVALYKRFFPSTCISFNGLATTETGTEFRRYFIDQTTSIVEPRVPVGYAVEGTEVLVLDETGQAVDNDCEGEIVVRSRYLSPGYWQRPALTREKFGPDARGGEERLYYTGDVGVLRSDGCLLHLGRRDFQVQIKGHRIEVAEVEAALLAIPAIEEAVVVARADEQGELRLVAYVGSSGQAAPTVSALRRALQACLASYMIPAIFVSLEALPRTPTGKVDRQGLPAPDRVRPHLDVPFARARTPIEATVAKLWAEALDLDRVGIFDQFLGGHSLVATEIVARIVGTFGVELPVRTLFEAPTVAEMAVVITQHRAQHRDAHDLLRPGEDPG